MVKRKLHKGKWYIVDQTQSTKTHRNLGLNAITIQNHLFSSHKKSMVKVAVKYTFPLKELKSKKLEIPIALEVEEKRTYTPH